jgi:hypothetical protein
MHVCNHTLAVIARFNRAIQYSETVVVHSMAAAYWIPRRSLSSGSPKARPGGGEWRQVRAKTPALAPRTQRSTPGDAKHRPK